MRGRWRVDAVGDRIEGRSDIASLRVGRRIAQRAVEIFAGVLFLVFAGKVQPIAAIAAIVGSLVPGVAVSHLQIKRSFLNVLCGLKLCCVSVWCVVVMAGGFAFFAIRSFSLFALGCLVQATDTT